MPQPSASSPPALSTTLLDAVWRLPLGSFAVVMATGIVSVGLDTVAAQVPGAGAASAVLAWIAALSYVVLVVLTAARILRRPRDVAADLRTPARAFGAFTFVAGTGVLGARLSTVPGWGAVAAVLLGITAVAWLVLGYLIPASALRARSDDAAAARGADGAEAQADDAVTSDAAPRSGTSAMSLTAADGTWFLWVVATQSVAVLASGLVAGASGAAGALTWLALICWCVGTCLYGVVGLIVVLRLFLAPVRPQDVAAPYWVAMGATAITVLAGAHLLHLDTLPTTARPLVAGLALLFWAFGTWLIPPLLVVGWWRHGRHHVPLRYELGLFSIVFPLGMYAVASQALGTAEHLGVIAGIGHGELWVAVAAWVIVFAWMLVAGLRGLRSPRGHDRPAAAA